jgi:FAD/FMN-containing dehydrogenase
MTVDNGTGLKLRAALNGAIDGTVIAGEPGYDTARQVWNGTVDKYPALVAFCRSPRDIAAAIRAARDTGVPLSVRGGGHQVAGLSVRDGGLTIDLAGMRTATVAPDGSSVRAGGGCLLGDLDSVTAPKGLVVPAGVVSETGLGGLALGGGVGWTMRNFGLTCDNIAGADVVTADGTVVRAGDGDDADLLWALRGGGGNFGVVTAFDLTTHQVPDVLFGRAIFALDDLPRALDHYVRTMAVVPDALTGVVVIRMAPPLPDIPSELVGRPVVLVNATWSGDLAAGDEPMRWLIESGRPLVGSFGRKAYLSLQTMQDGLQPAGQQNYLKSRYLDGMNDAATAALVAAGNTLPDRYSQIELMRLGGAIGRVDPTATAFAHRDAPFLLDVVAVWRDLAATDAHLAWARRTYAAMDCVGSDAGYINFLNDEPDRVRSVYPEATYRRLRQIKRRLDPDAVFTGNVPIVLDPAD